MLRLLVDRFGADRMMWGTGYPRTARLVPLADALRYIREELPLSESERERILWDSPAKLFEFPAK